MFINNLHNYPPLKRITAPTGQRCYLNPDNDQPLPSVTTILSATADKTHIAEWQNRVGLKKADSIRDEAAGLGTLLHTHMECHIREEERPRGNNLVRQLASRMADKVINKAFPKLDEIWGYEVPLWFPGLYAGTTDLVGIYDGDAAIMDYKTTKKMKRREWIGDYFDQTVAYSLAHNEIYGTNIRKGVIFMVSRELEYETFILEGAEYDKHEKSFLDRMSAFYAGNPEVLEVTADCKVEMVYPSTKDASEESEAA